MITIEEGAIGGFGSYVLEHCSKAGHLDNGNLKVRTMHLPDTFQDHDAPAKQYQQAGLDTDSIVTFIQRLLK